MHVTYASSIAPMAIIRRGRELGVEVGQEVWGEHREYIHAVLGQRGSGFEALEPSHRGRLFLPVLPNPSLPALVRLRAYERAREPEAWNGLIRSLEL